MKKFLLLSLALFPLAASASNVGGSGTQPYACTVVGNSTLNLVSTGQNQLTASGPGSIIQNGNTTYSLGAVGITGPDANVQAATTAIGNTLSVSASESAGTLQAITGELSESVTYTVTISSSDGILSAGSYTSAAELTCAAT